MKKLVVVLMALALAACAKSELHNAMEAMGDSLKVFAKSESQPEMAAALKDLLAALSVARQQMVKPEDQANFDEGLENVQMIMDDLQASLRAGNIAEAKSQLPELKKTIEKYHELLGVE